jgi:hypothetical protein
MWVVVLGVAIFFYGWMSVLAKKRSEYRFGRLLRQSPEFVPTQSYIGINGGISIDERGTLALVDLPNRVRFVGYWDLVEVELQEDGETVTRTSRSSQFASAVVGGVLFGGVGAVVGGLTGKKVTGRGKVTRLSLKIVVNSTSRPMFVLEMLARPQKRDAAYNQLRAMADHWHGLTSVLIRRAQKDDSPRVVAASPVSSSVAEQLTQMSVLVDKGLLTSEEFSVEKRKLLARA